MLATQPISNQSNQGVAIVAEHQSKWLKSNRGASVQRIVVQIQTKPICWHIPVKVKGRTGSWKMKNGGRAKRSVDSFNKKDGLALHFSKASPSFSLGINLISSLKSGCEDANLASRGGKL